MSTLTMPSSPPWSLTYPRAWQDTRPSPPHERIALPSIRQTFPELRLQIDQDSSAREPPSTGMSLEPHYAGITTALEYVHSPTHYKRRRLSFEYGQDIERTNSIPRLCANSPDRNHRQLSPSRGSRTSLEPLISSNRASPPAHNGARPSTPLFMQQPGLNMEHRPRPDIYRTLPSLAMINHDRKTCDTRGIQGIPSDEYMQEAEKKMRTSSITSIHSYGTDGGSPAYRPASYGYGLHHPNRLQSLSVGSVQPVDRTPFSPGPSPGPYSHQFHDAYMRIHEISMSMNGDGKQRKRRGNLPKETTDKLRTWFVAHLHHPYPSEEEKQELMRQTGLQLNQISNWFINARRRQLPTMISNARAESEAMTVRGGDGKPLPSTERADYEPDSQPLSDGEGSPFRDVELESIKRRRVTGIDRGSI
ncbi:hypothetical protein GGS26DRAFT_493831 [Hypomontagnella submonticulosa]|nr:hypothetical protein GGS26DRAFT_493831 [Hypomontagnella submonticulosa]